MKPKLLFVLFAIFLSACFSSAQVLRLEFNPAVHGFHFANRFKSHGPIQTGGLCGGMCLAAFNFFRYGMKIPPHKDADIDFDVNYDLSVNTSGTDALTDYIFQSQLATFTNISMVSFSGTIDPVYTNEFNKTKAKLENKQYVILGLKGQPGHDGHQVLCYGYDVNGLKLFVYDPNHPDVETYITPTPDFASIILHYPDGSAEGAIDKDYKDIFVAQELYKNKLSNRTTYDMVDNVLRDLNYAVKPPSVPAPHPKNGFGYKKASTINYEAILPPNDVYRIKNDQYQKYVEVEDDAITKGTRVQQYFGYQKNGLVDGHNQEWLLIPAGTRGLEQAFYIINNGFLKYLQSGTGVTVQEGNAAETNQLWFLQPAGGADKFFVKSVSSGTYLEMPSSAADGQALKLSAFTGGPNQVFTFIHFVGYTGLSSSMTGFLNVSPTFNNGKGLDATENGATNNNVPMVLSDLSNQNEKQQFQFVRDANGYYEIKSKISNTRKCLETNNDGTAECWDCANVKNQKWIVVPVVRESGKYILFNRNSGKCLYAAGNTANPVQYKYVNQDNYKWFIKPAR